MNIPRKMAPGEHLTAALYNALLDYVRRITPIAGSNVTVDYMLGGARINGTPVVNTGSLTRPWKVRYHESGESGQWEVYIPAGSMSVGDTCKVLNRKANSVDGHESDGHDWYVLKLDESDGTAESDGGVEFREFHVIAHGKMRAMRQGVDSIESDAGSGVYVSAVRNHIDEQTSAEEMDDDAFRQGDVHRQTIAIVRVSGPEGSKSRSIRQIAESQISVGTKENRPFDLVWWFSVDDDCVITVDHVYCVRQSASLAGTDLSIDQSALTDVKGANKVYLHIVTQGGANVGSVVCDPVSTPATDDQTWILLYEMDGDVVESDSRTENLSNVQYYR